MSSSSGSAASHARFLYMFVLNDQEMWCCQPSCERRIDATIEGTTMSDKICALTYKMASVGGRPSRA